MEDLKQGTRIEFNVDGVKVYGTRLNRIKDMILTKLDSFRNSSKKQS